MSPEIARCFCDKHMHSIDTFITSAGFLRLSAVSMNESLNLHTRILKHISRLFAATFIFILAVKANGCNGWKKHIHIHIIHTDKWREKWTKRKEKKRDEEEKPQAIVEKYMNTRDNNWTDRYSRCSNKG